MIDNAIASDAVSIAIAVCFAVMISGVCAFFAWIVVDHWRSPKAPPEKIPGDW